MTRSSSVKNFGEPPVGYAVFSLIQEDRSFMKIILFGMSAEP